MNIRPSFTFPGLWPYIERAAEGRELPHLGRGRGLWHYKQVQDALGQLPALEPDGRRELFAYVGGVRDALAAALDGIDLAIRETRTAVDGGATELERAEIETPPPVSQRQPVARRKRP
ncbi:hypothetical protein [Paludisphaera mucosa]|uniref:Uncharacterized protein n=1 Tax=Paludisphaera mucosa TaxID=3030827 RepID=A0ABT6FD88_9BACT|nr:hypothetical protein [Paludisphaera mucosa]MDG3005507.1 hypothetical protein [Paludisphaera mucosa]